MVAILRQGLTNSLPLTGAAVAGVVVALLCAVLPGAWLDALADGIGLSALVPVGLATRIALALSGGVVIGAVAWAALYLLFGPGGPFALAKSPSAKAPGTQTIRRADAHPDAPPRRPLSAAAELARPPAPPLVQPLPADLNAPLAAFDPTAILPVPREPVRPVPPLAPGERMETFALQPDRPPAREPDSERPIGREPDPQSPSIDALLRRLEAGAERRVAQAR